MKRTVHPAFDGVWFVELEDGQVHEAKTLAELSKKIGKKYAIEGYYPNGYDVKVVWPQGETTPANAPKRVPRIGKNYTIKKV